MSDHSLLTDQPARMEQYYRVHAKIYDATRWSFLFGRDALVKRAAAIVPQPRSVLEIGCGTGVNLLRLRLAFPQAELVGIDAAAAMITVAQRSLAGDPQGVQLIHAPYSAPLRPNAPFDLIVCSYALSMINPGWDDVLGSAQNDLAPGGAFAAADFHASAVPAFKRWMGVNHVRMDAHLLPDLRQRFTPRVTQVSSAYGGLWQYMLFVGTRS